MTVSRRRTNAPSYRVRPANAGSTIPDPPWLISLRSPNTASQSKFKITQVFWWLGLYDLFRIREEYFGDVASFPPAQWAPWGGGGGVYYCIDGNRERIYIRLVQLTSKKKSCWPNDGLSCQKIWYLMLLAWKLTAGFCPNIGPGKNRGGGGAAARTPPRLRYARLEVHIALFFFM